MQSLRTRLLSRAARHRDYNEAGHTRIEKPAGPGLAPASLPTRLVIHAHPAVSIAALNLPWRRIDSRTDRSFWHSSQVNSPLPAPAARHSLVLFFSSLLALAPLTSSVLVDSLSLALPLARWAHLLAPPALGFVGIGIGIVNFFRGNRWLGTLQLAVTIAATIWAWLIAGFALATTHGQGI